MNDCTPPDIELATLDTLSTVADIIQAMLTGQWMVTEETLESCAGMIWRRTLVHRADQFVRRTA